jgi:hypothetical protein
MLYNEKLLIDNRQNGIEKVMKIWKLKLMATYYEEIMRNFFFPYGTTSWKNNVLLLTFY